MEGIVAVAPVVRVIRAGQEVNFVSQVGQNLLKFRNGILKRHDLQTEIGIERRRFVPVLEQNMDWAMQVFR